MVEILSPRGCKRYHVFNYHPASSQMFVSKVIHSYMKIYCKLRNR